MKEKQLSLYIKNDEFSMCCAQKLDDRLIIHAIEKSRDKSLIEHYLRNLKDKFKIKTNQQFLINTGTESVEKCLLIERLGFSPRFVQITDWKSILQLSKAIAEKYIRYTSKEFGRTLEGAILRNIHSSRSLGVEAGSVALFCEELPLGDWTNINSLAMPTP